MDGVIDTEFVDQLTEKELKALYDSLTEMQQKFVDVFDGNASKAAREAGYSCYFNEAHRLMRHDAVIQLLHHRRSYEREKYIADRKALQTFWTSLLKDATVSNADRMRASELLGKSHAMFINTVKHEGGENPIQINNVTDSIREKIDEIYEQK